MQTKINNITDILKKINSKIFSEINSLEKVRIDFEFINLIMNTDIIIKILEEIEEQIEFSKINLLTQKSYLFRRKTIHIQ